MSNLFSLWKYIDHSCRRASIEDLSLPVIVLGSKNVISVSAQQIPKEQLHKYLLVEDGDFICNYGNLEELCNKLVCVEKASIYLGRGNGRALISEKNYVFRANKKIVNSDFLLLVFTSSYFLSKLCDFVLEYKKQKKLLFEESFGEESKKLLSGEDFWEEFKDFAVNFPDLPVQEKIIKKLEIINTLLATKKDINRELERLMELNFQLLETNEEALETRNFQELFEKGKGIEKSSDKKKRYKWKEAKSKFISSEICDSAGEGCEFCDYQICKADKLLLSRTVYEGEGKKYELKLWVGCDGFISNSNLHPIFPKKETGVPYSYYLLKTNLDKLITSTPGATTTRTVSWESLQVFDFQLHPEEKIIEFNKICESIFEHQKILEEEINKLSKLLERKKKLLELKVFEEKGNG